MKIVLPVLVAGAAFLAALSGARADDPTPLEAGNNPYAYSDPDGVPLSVTRKPQRQPTAAEIALYHQRQEKAVLEKDWLVRSYEQQLQLRSGAKFDNSSNLYYQVSTNKDLAKLAGLNPIDAPNNAAPDPKAQPDATSPAGAPSRKSALGSSLFFKPLITPISAPDAAGMHNFYSSLPTTEAPAMAHRDQTPRPAAAAAPAANNEPSMLDTPGMTAAQNDPALAKPDADLTLDILPGESIEQARLHQDNPSRLQLALPSTVTAPSKPVTGLSSVPGAPTGTQPPVAPAAPARNPSDEPIPITKMSPPATTRPVASPNDIFYR